MAERLTPFFLMVNCPMSSLDAIRQLLDQYDALELHHNPVLSQRLKSIQHWQTQRMLHIHANLFAIPKHQPLANYFITRLYGSSDINLLAQQCQQALRVVKRYDGLIGERTLKIAFQALELSLLSITLDLTLARLLTDDLPSNPHDPAQQDQHIIQLYHRADQAHERRRLLGLLDNLGFNIDRYIHSPLVRNLFKSSKALSTRNGLLTGYTFLEEGFDAMAPLESITPFISSFTQAERALIERIYAGTPHPLGRKPAAAREGVV